MNFGYVFFPTICYSIKSHSNGFQGTNKFDYYRRNYNVRRNRLKGLRISICYRWNSVKSGSVGAGFNCTSLAYAKPDIISNKVIRPKSRASALSKKVRQTNNFFFSKNHLKGLFTPSCFFSTIHRHKKRNKKPLKQFCNRPTN